MTQQNRDSSLDLIKIIAVFGVISLHTVDCTTGLGFSSSHIVPNIVYNIGVIAIPLFFMVNGYLLIGKTSKPNAYILRRKWVVS